MSSGRRARKSWHLARVKWRNVLCKQYVVPVIINMSRLEIAAQMGAAAGRAKKAAKESGHDAWHAYVGLWLGFAAAYEMALARSFNVESDNSSVKCHHHHCHQNK